MHAFVVVDEKFTSWGPSDDVHSKQPPEPKSQAGSAYMVFSIASGPSIRSMRDEHYNETKGIDRISRYLRTYLTAEGMGDWIQESGEIVVNSYNDVLIVHYGLGDLVDEHGKVNPPADFPEQLEKFASL